MNQIRSVCVFCGASTGGKDIYRLTAEALGRELVSRGIRLVYGAGSVGLMGVVARTVHERGGEVIGFIPEPLTTREMAGDSIGETVVVQTMHERKALMNEHCDAFIAMPGGFGTMDELFESLTLIQTGKSRTMPIYLYGTEFWSGLWDWVRTQLLGEGLISEADLDLVHITDDPHFIVNGIFDFYEKRGFAPSDIERAQMLQL